MLNITNDGWYGLSDGPYQHFWQSRVRALEQGMSLVRVANTGISAVISPVGIILKKMELGQAGVVTSLLPASFSPTLYARFGEWIYFLLFVLGGIIVMIPKYTGFVKPNC